MASAWTETEDPASMKVVFVFDGVDVEKREAGEIETFKQALSEPAREDEVRGFGSFLVRRPSSLDPLRWALIGLGLFLGFGLVELAVSIAAWWSAELPIAAQALLFLFGVLAPAAVVALRNMPRHASVPSAADRFTLELSPSGFSAAGRQSPRRAFQLDGIERFDGASRLSVLMKDGTRVDLPCGLPSRDEQAALAARLNEVLVNTSASAGGYRGALPRAGVRVESPDPGTEDEGELVDSSLALGRRSAK
jgi:hypothetical protein